MNRKSIATILKFGAVAFLLFVLLFVDGIWTISPSFISSALREITTVCRDAGTQRMLVLCLACYLVVFLILERRARSGTPYLRFINPNLWLAGLVLLALFQYALAYDTVSRSIQIPVLMTGVVFGKAIATWAAGGLKFRHPTQNPHPQPLSHPMGEGGVAKPATV
jgi:hypothetical protein